MQYYVIAIICHNTWLSCTPKNKTKLSSLYHCRVDNSTDSGIWSECAKVVQHPGCASRGGQQFFATIKQRATEQYAPTTRRRKTPWCQKQAMSHIVNDCPLSRFPGSRTTLHSKIISTEYSRFKEGLRLLTDHLRHGVVELDIVCWRVISQRITKVQRCYTEGYRVQQRFVWQTSLPQLF